MDFFGRQEWARRRSKWLIGYFVAAVVLIVAAVNVGSWFGLRLSGAVDLTLGQWWQSAGALAASLLTLLVIAIGSVSKLRQLAGGGKAVAEMVGARRVLPETGDVLEKRLLNVVEEMAIASGTAMPRVHVLDDESGINAFVAGLTANDTVLVVTRGALQQLNRQELQGVIGHEYSHILHGDMQLNVRLMGVLAGILLLGQFGEFLLRSMRHVRVGGSRKSGNVAGAVVLLAVSLVVIGYAGLFFGRLIKAAIARQREFLADASAVQYTRDNAGIASALGKIQLAPGQALLRNAHAEDMSHLCFGASVKVAFSGWLSTHPPLADRIEALGFTPTVLYRRLKESASTSASAPDTSTRVTATAPDELPVMAAAPVTSGAAGNRPLASARVGHVTPAHVEQARELLASLTPAVQAASQDRLQVGALMLALMLTENDARLHDARALLASRFDRPTLMAVNALLTVVQTMPAAARLAVVIRARPALEGLSEPDRRQLLDGLLALARLDELFTPFEFALTALLRHWLLPETTPAGPALRRYTDASAELALVCALMAQASGARHDDVGRHYQLAVRSFGIEPPPLPESFDAVALDKALRQLDRLLPLLKKPLLNTLAELALGDAELTAREQELLRVVAERLNCPLPIVLPVLP